MTEQKFEMKENTTIIITDSNPNVASFLVEGLRKQGYDAVFKDAISALIYLKNIQPEKNLPVLVSGILGTSIMDGFELLKRTKDISKDTKFIFYTGWGNRSIDEYIDRARCSGANALVQKESPLREEGALQPLYNSIERVLRGEPFFVVRRGEGR